MVVVVVAATTTTMVVALAVGLGIKGRRGEERSREERRGVEWRGEERSVCA